MAAPIGRFLLGFGCTSGHAAQQDKSVIAAYAVKEMFI